MRVLAINTYAGSLLVGASGLANAEIIGSYEDKGFFQPVAKANFPSIEHLPSRRTWPTQDLSDTVVVAHPPCSAFSVQNTSAEARGVDAAAFQCTRTVLDYAMANRALAICIESVMGALAGAWPVHEKYAREHGYHCYRILENGCMWGCQWRERFWAVWIRKGAAPTDWHITLKPNFQVVKDVVTGYEDGPTVNGLNILLDRLKVKLREEAKLTPEQMSILFDPQDPPHSSTWIVNIMWDRFFKEKDSFPEEKWYIHQDYVGGFSTGVLKFIDPNGLAPVLLADSFWYYNGRCLSEAGYKRIMGFPANYIFPDGGRKNYRKIMRVGLSKGVMPPIMTWLLDQLGSHLGMHASRLDFNNASTYGLTCLPDRIVDFRVRKEDWLKRDEKLPELRHYDDEREIRKNARERQQLRSSGGFSPQIRTP